MISQDKNVHHGRNIKYARSWKGLKQEDLAEAMNLSQSQVSMLESQAKIDDETIKKVATVLGIDDAFIKNFEPENAMRSFNLNFSESPVTISSAENSREDIVIQGEQENITYNTYNPLEKVSELYERIVRLKVELANSKNENEKLRLVIDELKLQIEELKKP